MTPAELALTDYRTLGRSGLVVSPLALGTMTFGNDRWGSAEQDSAQVFGTYVNAGGNFFDTADTYSKGRSEALLGEFVSAHGLRDAAVLASKFTWNATPGQPNTSGNGRKNIHRALDGTLARLKTDYLDLYWLHHWDQITPVEEVLQTLGDLVRAGRVRYFGFSNVPAWYAAQAATLAQVHGVPGPVALQLEYSLTARGLEHEHAAAARHLGLGLTPWSPLAAGFLAGKYRREDGERQASGEGRLSGPNPFGSSKFTEANWHTLEVLKRVAGELGRPPAQVALAWVVARPGVTSPIVGARTADQLRDSLAALEIRLSREQLRALDEASSPPSASGFPGLNVPGLGSMYAPGLRPLIFGGAQVKGWQEQQDGA